jgi:CDP-6-deoxy-D-xylo-4-hexulose-3-dehydrase
VEAVEANDIILIEDCCEAHGARHGDRKVGTLGLGSTFSFYFGHHMSTIEGGMVCTDDPDLADEIRLMRAHGLARESSHFDEYAARSPNVDRRFLFVHPGLNFRSTELNALLGLRQLGSLDARIEQRNRNMMRFIDRSPDGLWSDFRTDGMSSFALPIVAETPAGRATVERVTGELGIETRPVVAGDLLRHPFIDGRSIAPFDGPPRVAEHIHRAGLYVGNGHHVTEEMVDTLCDELENRHE